MLAGKHLIALAASLSPAASGQQFTPTPQPTRLIDLMEMTPDRVTRGLQRRYATGVNTTVAVWTFDKGARVPEHSHPNEQVSYIQSGRVRVIAGGRSFEVGPGQVLLIPPGLPHAFEALEPTVNLDFFAPDRVDWRSGPAR